MAIVSTIHENGSVTFDLSQPDRKVLSVSLYAVSTRYIAAAGVGLLDHLGLTACGRGDYGRVIYYGPKWRVRLLVRPALWIQRQAISLLAAALTEMEEAGVIEFQEGVITSHELWERWRKSFTLNPCTMSDRVTAERRLREARRGSWELGHQYHPDLFPMASGE